MRAAKRREAMVITQMFECYVYPLGAQDTASNMEARYIDIRPEMN